MIKISIRYDQVIDITEVGTLEKGLQGFYILRNEKEDPIYVGQKML